MRVLALDTTTREGSVALVEDDRVVSEYPTDPMRAHGERLPGDLLDLLKAHKLTLADVDLFAIAAGPGSFTGLRIGIACVQGLATVLRKPVVATSVLEAMAQWAAASREPGATIASWMDAHRGEVFSARYRVAAGQPFAPDRLEEIEAPTVGTAGAILERWASGPLPETLVGDGAVEYAYLVPESVAILEHPVISGAIGRMAVARAARGQVVSPAGIQPIYVRRPDAELARERRLGEAARGTMTLRAGASDWTIEPLSSFDEIDYVIELERESFSKPWTRDMYIAELSNRDVSSLLLAKDGARQPIGFCCFWRVFDELHINNLAVTPPMRRRGLGTALLVRALDEGYRLGARRALLEVRHSNVAARRLYKALGFRPNGVRRGYYTQPDEDALMLTVALPLLVG